MLVDGDLTTKQDMKDLKDELHKMEYRLVINFGAILTALASAAIAIFISVFKHWAIIATHIPISF